jgi:hypothetical protein
LRHETPSPAASAGIAKARASESPVAASHIAQPGIARRISTVAKIRAAQKPTHTQQEPAEPALAATSWATAPSSATSPSPVTSRSHKGSPQQWDAPLQLSGAPGVDGVTSPSGETPNVASIDVSSVDLPLWSVPSDPAPAGVTSAAARASQSDSLGPTFLTAAPSESVAAAPLSPPASSNEPQEDALVEIASAARATDVELADIDVADVDESDAEIIGVAEATGVARPTLDVPPPPGVAAATGANLALSDEAPTVYTRLDALAWECHTSQWAGRALELLRQFDAGLAVGNVDSVVAAMRSLSHEADQLASTAQSEQLSADIRRARHALVRSTDAWRLAVAVQSGTAGELALAERRDSRRLAERLRELTTAIDDDQVAKAWREYLMLDVITSLSVPQPPVSLEDYRDVVEQTVRRLDGRGLSARQREYVSQQRFAALASELKTWVAEPVDAHEFLTQIDAYERTRLPSQARRVARDLRHLSVSSDAEVQQLGKRMEAHYRNANLRIVIAAGLVSRLLPTLPETDSPVRQRIMDADVRGWQHTETNLSARLVPDAERLHVVLEAEGSVTANTHAHSGPATLRNSSVANFQVQKPLLHSAEAISTEPAAVTVDARICLRDVATALDIIPLVGGITRHIVEQQALEQQAAVRRIMQRQVASEVSRRVDELADEKLVAMNQAIQQRFFEPMRSLGLAPAMVETRTDEQRMTLRMRLASDNQLGSHTPRPRAPSDSVLSIQIHDSAINNLIEQFNLEGGTFTPDELRALVSEKLNREPGADDGPTPDTSDVRITFASEDPVRIRCEDGLVHVRLAFGRFERGDKVWQNVVAQADYRPRIEGFTVRLEREGTTQLSGAMSRRQRVALRTIFAKVLPRQRELANVIPKSVDTTQITDLEITQLVLADGWIGVAVGPRHADVAALATPAAR